MERLRWLYGPVVLATGGYAADFTSDSLLKKHHPEYYDHCTGVGQKTAMVIGASAIDLEKVQVHPTGLVDPNKPNGKVKFPAAEAPRGVGGLYHSLRISLMDEHTMSSACECIVRTSRLEVGTGFGEVVSECQQGSGELSARASANVNKVVSKGVSNTRQQGHQQTLTTHVNKGVSKDVSNRIVSMA